MSIIVELELHTLTCWAQECGVSFAIPWNLYAATRDRGGGFYCPRGHHLGIGEAEIDVLKKKLAAAQDETSRWMARTQEEIRSKRAIQGEVTKLKNRIGCGVCPCCQRHFTNVERHMATKHPEFRHGP